MKLPDWTQEAKSLTEKLKPKHIAKPGMKNTKQQHQWKKKREETRGERWEGEGGKSLSSNTHQKKHEEKVTFDNGTRDFL